MFTFPVQASGRQSDSSSDEFEDALLGEEDEEAEDFLLEEMMEEAPVETKPASLLPPATHMYGGSGGAKRVWGALQIGRVRYSRL